MFLMLLAYEKWYRIERDSLAEVREGLKEGDE